MSVPPAPGQTPQPYPYQQQMYQPQPGAWSGQPMQYAPMPVVPKAPSPLTDPKTLTEKLPLIAQITFIAFAVVGLVHCIVELVTPAYGASVMYRVQGIFDLIYYCALGLVFFAILMWAKHLIDLKEADAKPIVDDAAS